MEPSNNTPDTHSNTNSNPESLQTDAASLNNKQGETTDIPTTKNDAAIERCP